MLKKLVLLSGLIFAAVSAIRITYGLITREVLTYNYVLMASFWVGALFIVSGILIFIMPAFLFLKRGRLLDSTTYNERVVEERIKKNSRSFEHIIIGTCIIFISGIVQFVAWSLF